MGYHFPLFVQWLPDQDATSLEREIARRRETQPAKRVVTVPIAPLTGRLWEALVAAAGIGVETRWASLSAFARHQLVGQLLRTELPVSGKSTNKDEFVTCGGVPLREVNFKTMESRVCSGLYLTGELLDIDGVTGGFNFQAAWTTGWIAGKAMAEALAKRAGGGWNQTTHRPV
jgi:predicted Rossmann fold flavoprotein